MAAAGYRPVSNFITFDQTAMTIWLDCSTNKRMSGSDHYITSIRHPNHVDYIY